MNDKRRMWQLGALMVVVLQVALLLGASPAAAASGQWWGDYFANPNLSGAPVLSRYDSAINFTWGSGSPSGAVPKDNFSAWMISKHLLGPQVINQKSNIGQNICMSLESRKEQVMTMLFSFAIKRNTYLVCCRVKAG